MRITFFFLILFYHAISAQNSGNFKLDSLKIVLKKTTSKKAQIDLNTKISKLYFSDFDFENALYHTRQNIQIAKRIPSKSDVAEAYKYMTLINVNKPDIDSAFYYVSKAIPLFKQLKNDKGLAKCYLYYSAIYQRVSNFSKQAEYNYKSIQIARQIKDTTVLESNNRSLAMLYLDQKNYKKALYHSFESLKYAKQLNNIDKIATSESSLAETYSMMGLSHKALVYFKSAYVKFNSVDNTQGKAWTLTNWANLVPPAEELKMRLEAQKYWEIIAPENMMSMNNLASLGTLYYKMSLKSSPANKNYLKIAETYLEKSLALSDQNGNIDNSVDFLKTLAQIQAKNGHFEKAYTTYSRFNTLNDSLFSQENKNKIAELESAKKIELRDKTIMLNKLTLANKEKQKWYLIGGILLLCVIGGLLFYQSRSRQKINEKLQLLNDELDQANKTKTRFFSILNHDLRSPVSNLIHFLHLQKENPELLDEESKKRMENKTILGAENLLNSMEDILLWSKGQMENFKPQNKNVTITAIFEDTKNHFLSEEKIKIHFENKENSMLNTDENFLKTIIRNLTGNAIKALEKVENPTIIWKAWQNNNQTFLSITDNGLGGTQEQFKALYDDTEVVGIKTGLGLHLIRDLAKAIDCEIMVESKPNQSTTFTLHFSA